MKSMKVAVFGHYDSRGGTMAFPLQDKVTGTESLQRRKRRAEVERVMDFYDRELFGWTPAGPTSPGIGDQREVMKTIGAILNPDNIRPSHEDFLFVADLWCGDFEEEWYDIDLERSGFVVIDSKLEPAGMGPDGREVNPWDLRLVTTLDQPVQLEFVKCSEEEMEAFRNMDEDVRDSILMMKLRVLDGSSPTIDVRCWDDDAFGFIINAVPAEWQPQEVTVDGEHEQREA